MEALRRRSALGALRLIVLLGGIVGGTIYRQYGYRGYRTNESSRDDESSNVNGKSPSQERENKRPNHGILGGSCETVNIGAINRLP